MVVSKFPHLVLDYSHRSLGERRRKKKKGEKKKKRKNNLKRFWPESNLFTLNSRHLFPPLPCAAVPARWAPGPHHPRGQTRQKPRSKNSCLDFQPGLGDVQGLGWAGEPGGATRGGDKAALVSHFLIYEPGSLLCQECGLIPQLERRKYLMLSHPLMLSNPFPFHSRAGWVCRHFLFSCAIIA